MAYVEYPIEHMDIRSLHLDVSNYRFAADQPSETAALNYLWAEEKVSEVAELILRDGYVDIEQPLTVVEGGRHIVLEGNRRVSALMALHDPSLAPAHQADIERLLRRFALEAENLPQSIRVMVLPDRADAAPILARLHIGVSKKRWDLDEQAKFVIAQLGEGVTIEQLSATLPGIENVPRVVRMGNVRGALKKTPFTDESLAKYARGSRLKMSSFEYAYRQSVIRDLIGLQFDGQARVVAWAQTPKQLVALERLLRGFKSGELNTRRGLKPETDEFRQLLAEMTGPGKDAMQETKNDDLTEMPGDGDAGADGAPRTDTGDGEPSATPDGDQQPELDTPGDDTAGIEPEAGSTPYEDASDHERGDAGDDDPQGMDADGAGRRGPNDPLSKVYIQLTGIDELAQPITMQRRLRELRQIQIYQFPAAAAMLIRSILEAAIKEHFGGSNGIDAVGELSDVMRLVANHYRKNGQLANAINKVTRFGHDQANVPGTGRWFNTITHSVNVDVNGRQVQEAWLVVLPLVRFMLNEPHRAA